MQPQEFAHPSSRDAPPPSPDGDPDGDIVMAMRQHTADLHHQAERSGVIADLLAGTVSRHAYTLLLRNLHPVYQALEAGLEQHRHSATLGPLARRELYRTNALAADLTRLAGPTWPTTLPLLPAAQRYTTRLQTAAQADGRRLLAHAYTRFLGDLSGGRILSTRLASNPHLPPGSLSFYDYPDIHDLAAFKSTYRTALTTAGQHLPNPNEVLTEASIAFQLNIDLSQEITQRSPPAGE